VKNFLRTFISLVLITQAYSQWIQKQLPIQSDVWGLESKDSVIFAGTEIGFQGPGYVFRSMDFGVSWDTVNGLPYAGGWCFDFSDSILVAGSFGWGISLSSDLGNTWTIPDSGIISNENVHVIIKHKNYVFAGTVVNDNGVLRSSDNGRSWIPVNNGLPIGSFISLASNGNDLYTGMASNGEVFRSTDDGMSWFYSGNGLPSNSHIAALAVKESNVYAGIGSGEGVYYSSDSGENWAKISASTSIGQVWTLALDDSNIFVGSIGTGVFLTQDNGTSWRAVNEGLTHLNIRSLLVTSDKYLYAGTTNGFVCSRPIAEMLTDVEDQRNEIPFHFLLEQNYPNPFNPSTKIKYSVPQSSNVIIKVFDILGNEIETLVNEEKPVGTYEITWYTATLPSGIYFYKLQAGSFVETKKMILLK
jgi:photosystem II stability/assembly factor-like uncharacterized protein